MAEARPGKRQRPEASVARCFGKTRLGRLSRVRFLGRGQFGSVAEYDTPAKAGSPSVRMAMKQPLHTPGAGADLGSIKELAALAELAASRGTIRLLEAVPGPGRQVWLGLERCVSDLQAVINDPDVVLGAADVKRIAMGLLEALAGLHESGWMHRDLKPENVLVSGDAEARLKLADFGHAAKLPSTGQRLGHSFATVWYRAPELMLHAPTHDSAVDVWAAGCIVAEAFLRRPLFPGEPGGTIAARDEEEGTLAQVFRLRGTPSEAVWPGCEHLPGWRRFEPRPEQSMADVLAGTAASPAAADLLLQLLQLDPARRPSARRALGHAYFTEQPAPTPLGRLPLPVAARRAAAAMELARRRAGSAEGPTASAKGQVAKPAPPPSMLSK